MIGRGLEIVERPDGFRAVAEPTGLVQQRRKIEGHRGRKLRKVPSLASSCGVIGAEE
jgi:hypothetical protein